MGPAGVPNHHLCRTEPMPRCPHPREPLQYPSPARGVPGATVRRCEAAERGPRGSHTQCKPSRRSATLVPAEEELGQRSSGRRIAERRARPHLHSRRGPAPLLRKSSTCHSNRRGKSRPPRHLLDGARRPARLIGGLPAGRRAGPCGAGSSGVAAECLRCAAPNLVSGSLIFF